jgi:Dolichyl-phosphate-mannose-protein mannosyltransferase
VPIDVGMDAAVATRVPAGLRARTVPVAAALAALVGLSAVVRFVFSALRLETPVYLPDEYTYSALARGIAETGHPVIRGVPSHFPALLEPLLAAPFWLPGNPELALRLTQGEHVLFMSLAAIPVYLLARRLDLGKGTSLVAAAFALATPDFVFGSFIVADPIAYPLVLAAVYVAVVALDEPSRKMQLLFVGLVGLATFARVQYVLLAPVVIVAALVVERGSLRRAWRKLGLATSIFGALGALAVASGPQRILGTYDVIFHLSAPVATIAHQIGMHTLLIPFAAGIVLVPGALVGLVRGVARPQSTVESAFATITTLFAFGLIAQAIFIGSTISGNFGERYLFFFIPLLPLAFVLYARRGGAKGPVLAIAGILAVLAMRFPLSHYAGRSSDSPTLWGVLGFETWFGVATGALLISLAAVALAAVAAYVGLRPKSRVTLALTVALAAQVGIASAAAAWNVNSDVRARDTSLPADAQWIDHAGVGPVTLVEPPGSDFGSGMEQLLWNRSLTGVALLPHANPVDSHANRRIRVGSDGTLVVPSGPIAGPILVDRSSTWTSFAGATLVRSTANTGIAPFDLWRPTGDHARLTTEVAGLRGDNWLMRVGWITVWPAQVNRRLTLRLGLPSKLAAADTIHFTGAGRDTSFTVQPDETRTISFVIPAGTRPWTVHWLADRYGFRQGSEVSFLSGPPRITAVAGPLG